jgi:hypothetical protein
MITALRFAVVAALATATCLTGSGHAVAQAQGLSLPLHVVGNRIVDATGSTVVLRGLQRDGTEGGAGSSGVPVTTEELRWMTNGYAGSWRAGVVRVPVGAAQWTGACPSLAGDPTAYRAAIDSEVATITAAGAVALLDLHTGTGGCTSIARHAMPDTVASLPFWSDAARHYAGNGLVAFELYNEPHYVSDAVWLNGGSVQDCDPAASTAQARLQLMMCQAKQPRYEAVGMQRLYDVVSAAAPDHLIVVDGTAWGTAVPTLRVNAHHGQLVYAVHPYSCPTPGAACDTTAQAKAAMTMLRSWQPLAATAPVFASELGWPRRPNGSTYVDGAQFYVESLAFFARQSPAWGYVAFAFDGTTTGAFSLYDDRTTYLPNSTGLPVYAALRAAA